MNKKRILLTTTLLFGGLCGVYNTMYINSCDSYAITQTIQVGTTKTALNMREGKSTSYKILTTLPKGTTVTVLNKESNGWYKVQYNGKTGYVSGSYLTVTTQTINTDTSTSTTKQIGTTTANLNMRSSASTKGKILTTLPKGTKVDVLNKESNGWYKIQYNGKTGYVSGSYLNVTTQTTNQSSSNTSSQNTTMTGTVNTTVLNVRSGAGTNYSKIGSLKKGAKVPIVELLSNGWAKIIYNGNNAYVSSTYLDVYKAPVIPNDAKYAEMKALVNENQSNDSITKLVNKSNGLPSNYTPSNLVTPNVSATKSITVRQETATALEKMFYDAKQQGINLTLVSGFRSYSYQKSIYNNYLKYYGQIETDKYMAKAGYSEHQTGLAVDISSKSIGYVLENYFEDTKEGQWLKENAHKYGFILRYPKDRVQDTGYGYEPWHFRYIGTEIATYIYEHNLILEDLF